MPQVDFIIPTLLIKRLARGNLSVEAAKTECAALRPTQGLTSTRRSLKIMMTSASGFSQRGQFGQMCGALVVGFCVFGEAFLERVDAKRILIRTDPNIKFDAAPAELSAKLTATEISIACAERSLRDTRARGPC